MSLRQADLDFSPLGSAGDIRLSESKSSSSSFISKVEFVSSTSATHVQEFNLRFKPGVTGTENANINVDATFAAQLKMNVTIENATSVVNQLDIPYDDRIKIINIGGGDIFIVDKNLHLNTTDATFVTYSIGGIHVELNDLQVMNGVLFKSESIGNMTYVGAHNSSLRAYLHDDSTLCFPSSSAVVDVYPANKTDQVAFLGKQKSKFPCVKKPVPEREMTRLAPNKRASDLASPSNQKKVDGDEPDGTVIVLMFVGAIVGGLFVLVAVFVALRHAGCFEREKQV